MNSLKLGQQKRNDKTKNSYCGRVRFQVSCLRKCVNIFLKMLFVHQITFIHGLIISYQGVNSQGVLEYSGK